MRQFRHEFQVNACIKSVTGFHSSTITIKLLTPPPMFVKFNQIEPVSEGSRSDFTPWLGVFSIHRIAVHSGVQSTEGFTDTQVEGPIQTWVHQHSFQGMADDTTLIIIQIEGQPRDHILRGIISRFMWLTLPVSFSYRARQTRRAFDG